MIRAAFVELLGEKKNMETITVGELAERADIAKSTFYNHYDDVYAVAEEFENELLAKLSAVLDEIEHEGVTEYESCLKKIIEFLKENEDNYRKALEQIKRGEAFVASNPLTKWICINCGYVVEGTEPPKVCPTCSHPQGYSKRYNG
jgi:rubrerythrin